MVMKKIKIALVAFCMALIPTQNRCENQWLPAIGTALVAGIALYPLKGIAQAVKLYRTKSTQSDIEALSRPTTPEEEAFFRQYIPADATIRIIPNFASAFQYKNLIFIGEQTLSLGKIVALSDALANNDTDALNTFAGLAEHEYGHVKHNHRVKEFVINSITTITCAALLSFLTYKILPIAYYDQIRTYTDTVKIQETINWPLFSMCHLCAALYAWLIPAFVERSMSHQYEYQADDNIAPEHKKQMAVYLVSSAIIQQNNMLLHGSSHPSTVTRVQRLLA